MIQRYRILSSSIFQHGVCFIGILLLTSSLNAQSSFKVIGQVNNSLSGESISFANIRIGKTYLGTVTNEWGQFSINIPKSQVNDSIYISSIGYKVKKIPISSLEGNRFISIELEPNPYSLSTIEFQAKEGKLSARKIIRRAIKQFPKLYPEKPYTLTGYYRDYLKKDSTYLNLYEAALKVGDLGFKRAFISSSKINILGSKYNDEVDHNINIPKKYDNDQEKYVPEYKVANYGGNEFSLLMVSDPVRNYNRSTLSYVYRLKREFLDYHDFVIDSVLLLNNQPIYKIRIRLKHPDESTFVRAFASKAYIEGEIYINAENFSIHKFTYTNFNSATDLTKIYEIRLAYQNYREKMYLSYISLNNVFEFQESDTAKFTLSNGNIDFEAMAPQQYYQFREFFVSSIDPDPTKKIISNIDLYAPLPLIKSGIDPFSMKEFNALMNRPLRGF